MIENMFHSAALKLTLWYLAIIMVLSLGFSGIVYHFASNELVRSSQRQLRFFTQYNFPAELPDYNSIRIQDLDSGISRIKGDLIAFNLSVLICGGFISYYLARKTLRPIEESMEAQKRFTGDASHELRTPLAVIQTENEVALRNTNLSKSEAVGLLKSNLEEVAKLKRLSDGLLKLASFDGQPADHQVVLLTEVAEQAIERWTKVAADKKVTIKTSLKEARVKADSDSLIELASILLDNAIKYSGKGKTVTVKTYRKDKNAYMEVNDQGPGIKAADLPHIFDRFYRVDSSRSKSTDGYGLGLAIAKKIADMHEGAIEVKSTVGRGSSFSLRLPSV